MAGSAGRHAACCEVSVEVQEMQRRCREVGSAGRQACSPAGRQLEGRPVLERAVVGKHEGKKVVYMPKHVFSKEVP